MGKTTKTETITRSKPPAKIWVCNRADGKTTFGEYYNAKRRVFLEGKCDENDNETPKALADTIQIYANNTNRKATFAGDPLPPVFKAKLLALPKMSELIV